MPWILAGHQAPPSPLRGDSRARPWEPHGSRFSMALMPLACASVEGAALSHPFTQTIKLLSEIAPCNLLVQRHGRPGRRSKSLGRGLGRSGSCPVHAKTHTLCPWGARGVPGELAGSLLSHCRHQEKLWCKEGEDRSEGAWLQPQLQEGPSGYGRMWFRVRILVGGSPAGK